YALGIRDREYRGDATMFYRLNVGDVPIVTAVYPLGLQRGTEAEVHVEGVHLGPTRTVRVKAPADAAAGSHLPVSLAAPLGTPLRNPKVLVAEFPEVVAGDTSLALPVPGTANGRIEKDGATRPGASRPRRASACCSKSTPAASARHSTPTSKSSTPRVSR